MTTDTGHTTNGGGPNAAMNTQSQLAAIKRLRDRALARLGAIRSQDPREFDSAASKFLLEASHLGPLDHYKYFPEACHRILADFQKRHGVEAHQQLLYGILMHGILLLSESSRLRDLQERPMDHQIRQLQRIVDCPPSPTDLLSIDNDLYQKEFGIVTLRLYAAAAQLVDFRCGIPRSILFSGGARASLLRARVVAGLGGFRPYFQIHTHLAYLDEFNEEGWNECYRTCVDLYQLHPDVLGMFGASWFYDPALADISPRLRYLRAVPESGGASIMLAATQGEFVTDALATSPTRRKLYDEGKYSPKSYLLLWGREDQARWVRENARTDQG